MIVTDGDRVLQIITNLLSNAFRWTPDGGSVELGAERGERRDLASRSQDTGPGIGAEEQDRIFRPFWSHDGGGTGLGLAIARELARRARRDDRARERGRPRQPVRARSARAELADASSA